jgi:hypothetical protein
VIIDLRRVVRWPLRPLGLDLGHALANAHPSHADLQRWRAEQRADIAGQFPAPSPKPPADRG